MSIWSRTRRFSFLTALVVALVIGASTMVPAGAAGTVATTTRITSSVSPSVEGDPVTFSARITYTTSGGRAASGLVTFADGATVLGTVPVTFVSTGVVVATLAVSNLTVGTHTVTATYGGDATYAVSSASRSQVVRLAASSTVLVSSGSPSVFGQPVTLTATVPAGATGTVSFTNGGVALGSSAVVPGAPNGTASFVVANLAVGTRSLRAVYSGDQHFATSTSAVLSQVVAKAATTTALAADPNPSVFAQPVTLTATVVASAPGAGTPTGNVVFRDGATSLGTVALSGGVATLSTSGLGAASHALTATYSGSAQHLTSVSAGVSEVVSVAPSTLSLSSNANPSVAGQSVSFTASVSPAAATGPVTFVEGATVLATRNLAGGQAVFATTALAPGSHTIVASYAGSANVSGSVSVAVVQVVDRATASVAVTSSLNPSHPGDSVTLSATLTPVAPGTGTPTGTVTFLDGATVLGTRTLSAGAASLVTSGLAVGSHPVTVSYGGSTRFLAATSPVLSQVVAPVSIPAAIALSAAPTPLVAGQPGVLSARLAGLNPGDPVPTGTVTFSLPGVGPLGSAVVDPGGVATIDVTSTLSSGVLLGLLAPGGTVAWSASYSGDVTFAPGSASTSTPLLAASATVLTAGSGSSVFGESVLLSAAVSPVVTGPAAPGSLGGSVSFFDGAALLGTAPLLGGVATLAAGSLPVGSHGLTAVYGGDAATQGSSGGATLDVARAATSMQALAGSGTTIGLVPVVMTVRVTPVPPGAGSPVGSATFSVAGFGTIGAAPLAPDGAATLTVSPGGTGTYVVTVAYGGDANFSGSSVSFTHVVAPLRATTVTASVSPVPIVAGQPVTLSATVAAVGPGGPVPTGTVSFSVPGLGPLPAAPVGPDGTATLDVTAPLQAAVAAGQLPMGFATPWSASYSGDGLFTSSTGSSTLLVQAFSSIQLTVSPEPSSPGQPVTLTATVSRVSPANGSAMGAVEFFDGATSLGSATLSGFSPFSSETRAELTIGALGVGDHHLVATYAGAPGLAGSSTSTTHTVVAPSAPTMTLAAAPTPLVVGEPGLISVVLAAPSPGGPVPTGTVTFSLAMFGTLGSVPVGPGGEATFDVASTVSSGVSLGLLLPGTPLGWTATYSGDATYAAAASSSSTPVVAPSTIGLTVGPEPSVPGELVTLSVWVPGPYGPPTGTVEFFDGASSLGFATLDGGYGSLTTTALALGTHALSVSYTGDGTYAGSTGSATHDVVASEPSTLTLLGDPSVWVIGGQAHLRAVVNAVPTSGPQATGTVTFSSFLGVIATLPLQSGGVAVLDFSGMLSSGVNLGLVVPGGPMSFSATYSGDAHYQPSSATGSVGVRAPTTMTVIAPTGPVVAGQPVAVTVRVQPGSGYSGTPTGTVNYAIAGYGVIGTVPVAADGTVTVVLVPPVAGVYTGTATYSGDGYFGTSQVTASFPAT